MTSVLFLPLFAAQLKPAYAINSSDFNASVIDPRIKEDFLIFRFDEHRRKKSFRAQSLIKLFNERGLKLKAGKKRLIHVRQVSQVDLTPVKQAIKSYYLSHYQTLRIKEVEIISSSFISQLPKEYTLKFKSNAHYYATSTLLINDASSKKRLFVNYKVHGQIKLLKARHNINRGKILTQIDTLQSFVDFTRLKGKPLNFTPDRPMRARKRLSTGKILYEKDFEPVPAVLKGKHVLVRLINGALRLEFQAVALQDAYIGDEIYVQKPDKKRLLVKVVGKGQVEIR